MTNLRDPERPETFGKWSDNVAIKILQIVSHLSNLRSAKSEEVILKRNVFIEKH